MTKKDVKKNKKIVWGSIIGVVLVGVIVLIIALCAGGSNQTAELNESYFVSDDTKYVVETDTEGLEDYLGEGPEGSWAVYYYDDAGAVTGVKIYCMFDDNESAKSAMDTYNQIMEEYEATLTEEDLAEYTGDGIANLDVEGNYLILTAEAELYEGMTKEDVESMYIDATVEDTTDATDNAEE